jgi:hypothetical protein
MYFMGVGFRVDYTFWSDLKVYFFNHFSISIFTEWASFFKDKKTGDSR